MPEAFALVELDPESGGSGRGWKIGKVGREMGCCAASGGFEGQAGELLEVAAGDFRAVCGQKNLSAWSC